MSLSTLVTKAEADLEITGEAAIMRCSGEWTLQGIPLLERQIAQLAWPASGALIFEGAPVAALDSAGAWMIHRTLQQLERRGLSVTIQGFRPEHQALLQLIQTHASGEHAPIPPCHSLLNQLGRNVWRHLDEFNGLLAFLGEIVVAMLHSLAHPSRFRWRAILYNLQIAGFNALPIVGLLAFLMGVVVAYQGAVQLVRYGANIFVADLVGLSILREMAPLLTAIIVAGRSGSAYAAQIGTMKVTEEIDAMHTIGVSPMDLLVLPKMLALMVALPLLTVYADILGVLGGMIVAQAQLDVSFSDFLDRFDDAIKVKSFLAGLGKAPVFAAVIALVGCFQGFRVSGSADSVGRQTTVSVVQAIFLVIVFDAMFSVILSWLKI
jgi:phospholipid/cholesterol/gamma-HCH transport system permease protein